VNAPGFHWREVDGVRVLVPDFFDALGLCGGYSTRARTTGESLDLDYRGGKDANAVRHARRAVAAATGVRAERIVLGQQVHGARVAVVSEADAGRGGLSADDVLDGADALVTAAEGVALMGLAADCAIVLMADEGRRAVAMAHSGREGTAQNVAAAAVEALGGLGAAPGALYAAIGPAIGVCCYDVGEEAMRKFGGSFRWADEVFTIVSGRAHLDLPKAIGRQLIEAGVRRERVFDAGLCTSCHNDLFFSYRREREKAGRFAGVISIGKG